MVRMPSDEEAWPLISVCIPVKNGGKRLGRCLQSIRDLDYPQDRIEIIIADGRSTDNTVEVARSFGSVVLDNPGEIVASGRNVAFGAARGPFIASTDDDVIVPANWVRLALQTFDDSDIAAVGGISLLPEDAPSWAQAANHVFRFASKSGYSVQADHLSDGDAEDIPGCNAFYRTDAFRAVGRFDEDLITAEDVELHYRLRARGLRLKTSTELFVWHDKRPSPRGLFRQMRRFAEGRVQLSRKLPETLRPLHRLLGLSVPIGVVAAAVIIALFPLWALPAAALTLWVLLAASALADRSRVTAALLVGPALAVVILGWSYGYLKERLFPMTSTAGR
jgi:cellulose synthase/poly-beta-1,6-N-acetylglucosamine synthase-like glycosyltransferase